MRPSSQEVTLAGPFPLSRRTALAVGIPVVVVAATVGIVLGANGGGDDGTVRSVSPSSSAAAPSESASASATPTQSRPNNLSPLTGRPGGLGKPVLAVKVDNTASARPQVGLNTADVVYVEQVEGGLTRLMAIFNSAVPDTVGPVRSGRESDVELLKEYGHVGLAFSGAQHKVRPIIDAGSLVDLSPDRDATGYYRDNGRPAPYNLFLHPGQLLPRHDKVANVRDVGFRFGAPSPGGHPAAQVHLSMSASTTFTFRYDRSAHHYVEEMAGTPVPAAGGGYQTADNVLVQQCDVHRSRFHDFLGNYTPFTATVGHGRFWLLRDGKVWTGRWSRPKADGPTHYMRGGHDLHLRPGRTWVLLKDRGLPLDVS